MEDGSSILPVDSNSRNFIMSKKALQDVERKIAHLEEITKSKRHGKDSNDLKILQQLSDLYKRRAALSNQHLVGTSSITSL